jgi:thioredoxin 1
VLSLVISLAVGAGLGAALGAFGQCTSGTCPLTSTWWRGALYGAALGLMFHVTTGRSSAGSTTPSSTNVSQVAQADFDASVLRSTLPLVVDFYAPWCGPCKVMAPRLDKVADAYAGRVRVVKVNVDEAPDLASRYEIRGVPSLVFFSGGKAVDAMVGLQSEQDLRTRLDQMLAQAVRTTTPQAAP